ncbi:MAG: tRNA dihydrouridine synthase DusB [Eubacteriales bacterium]
MMRKTLEISGLKLENPFLLAPLAGVTDSAFRRVCKKKGAALLYTEMISAKALCYGDKKTESLLQIYDEEKPVGIQLFSAEPKFLEQAVSMLEDRPNALIDINMGCPVPKVVKNGEGAAILKNPYLAFELVKAAKKATRKPVTAKIRLGFDRKHINACEIARAIECAGADAICVHARTREEYYEKDVHWDEIAKVKEQVKIPVIGNGNIFSAKDAFDLMNQTNCDGVMIARGAQGNPWIFEELNAYFEGKHYEKPNLKEKFDLIMSQFDLAIEEKGEYVAVRQMRKHIAWYVKGLREASILKNAVNHCDSKEDIQKILMEYIEKWGEENDKSDFD